MPRKALPNKREELAQLAWEFIQDANELIPDRAGILIDHVYDRIGTLQENLDRIESSIRVLREGASAKQCKELDTLQGRLEHQGHSLDELATDIQRRLRGWKERGRR